MQGRHGWNGGLEIQRLAPQEHPDSHGEAVFWTGAVVETAEVCGPIALNLHAETDAEEVLWFVSLLHRDAGRK